MTDDGTKYGLNGFASESRGYAAIEPIWVLDSKLMDQFRAVAADGEEVPLVRINIGDLLDEAEKVCPD